jgi:hypothetical protein
MWRVAENVLNMHSHQPIKGGTPTWGLGEALRIAHGEKENSVL